MAASITKRMETAIDFLTGEGMELEVELIERGVAEATICGSLEIIKSLGTARSANVYQWITQPEGLLDLAATNGHIEFSFAPFGGAVGKFPQDAERPSG